jgi:hypothetical protein
MPFAKSLQNITFSQWNTSYKPQNQPYHSTLREQSFSSAPLFAEPYCRGEVLYFGARKTGYKNVILFGSKIGLKKGSFYKRDGD